MSNYEGMPYLTPQGLDNVRDSIDALKEQYSGAFYTPNSHERARLIAYDEMLGILDDNETTGDGE